MCFMQTLNTNITIQYGQSVPQGKSNSFLEVVNLHNSHAFKILVITREKKP